MQGRIKRRQGLRQAAERTARTEMQDGLTCALCQRPLGARVEWHHRVPKSKGGTETVPVHPICHGAIHAQVSNRDLAEEYADLDELRGREDKASVKKRELIEAIPDRTVFIPNV